MTSFSIKVFQADSIVEQPLPLDENNNVPISCLVQRINEINGLIRDIDNYIHQILNKSVYSANPLSSFLEKFPSPQFRD